MWMSLSQYQLNKANLYIHTQHTCASTNKQKIISQYHLKNAKMQPNISQDLTHKIVLVL